MARWPILEKLDFSSLLPSLSLFLERVGSGPIQLSVSLTDSAEVAALNEQLEALQSELERERSVRNRAELLFANECTLNNRLIDLCRENGVVVPQYMFKK